MIPYFLFNFEQILLYDMINLSIFGLELLLLLYDMGIVAYWYSYSSDFSLLRFQLTASAGTTFLFRA
jgi:hypothetical protein